MPEERRADAAREGEGARRAQARARHRRGVPGARRWLTFDAVIVGSGDQLARLRRAARPRRLARLRARAQRLARRRHPHRRADRARLPPRRLQRVASALGRRRRARGARRRARGARARVPEHRAADGDGVPGRRGGVPAAQRRRECAASSARVAGRARAVLPERRPRVRRPRHRALVAVRPRVRREGGAPARPQGLRRVRRRAAAVEPRLARADVRVGARARRCSRRGCCTPGSAPTPRRRAS